MLQYEVFIVYRATKHKLQQAEWSTKYIDCCGICAELTKDVAHLVKLRTHIWPLYSIFGQMRSTFDQMQAHLVIF